MAGLDTRGLASGFAQGFGLMSQHQQQQKQNERADQQMEMQAERFDMQKEQYEGQKQEAARAQEMEALQFTLGKISSGMDVDESEIELLRKNPKYWPALDPDTDASIEQAQQVIDPNTEVDANDPKSLAALNQMFGAEINKGDGGQKRVVGMYPGTDGESVMLELEVLGEDGSRYNAPMTRGRSNTEDDDTVMQIPVERMVEQTQGMRMLRNTMQGPEAQRQAASVLGILRGDSNESWELEEHPRLGAIQRNTKTGEIKPIRPGAGSPHDKSGGSENYWNRPTATQKDIEYMVTNGLAPDREAAWEMLRQGSGDNSYSRSEDRIDALRNRAEDLTATINGEGATIPSEEELEQAQEELRSVQSMIRDTENRTYGIDMSNGSDQQGSTSQRRSGTEGRGNGGNSSEGNREAESKRNGERGLRPGPKPEEDRDINTDADAILNKYF
ncbi:hypothetical protein [Halomonas sp. hl-4]|uniref:hypothetical protein n=1 Tax=Halomonas sp. hl-4 TaxID=1761789 RepID=UPI000BB7D647|nr:hypothetical protein [Halomonas sp. hl-4]SNY95585.1 hypothetical protein SAMN04488142_0086 [Halomonas sp. hl-4]